MGYLIISVSVVQIRKWAWVSVFADVRVFGIFGIFGFHEGGVEVRRWLIRLYGLFDRFSRRIVSGIDCQHPYPYLYLAPD